MLVSLKIDDIKNNLTELKGIYNDKNISPNVEVVCNEDTVSKTLKTLLPIFKNRNTKIIHVSYEGDLTILEEVLFSDDYSEIPIVLKRKLSEIGQVDLIMMGLPKNVKLVLYVDTEINNTMKTVHGYSQKYENISFCGNNLIALKGCRLGCTDKVIKDLVAIDGCYSRYKQITLDSIVDVEFFEAPLKSKSRSLKENKPKSATKVSTTKKSSNIDSDNVEAKPTKVVKDKKPKVKKKAKEFSSILASRLNRGR